MESENPEIVSILAAATVDSEKPRVSISAVRAADSFLHNRSLSSSFSSAGTVPIRAPLTIDEDDDDSVTEEHNSASSEDSRGFDSSSDEYETELEDASIGGVRIHSVLEEELGGEIGEGSVIYRPFSGDIDEETSVNYSSLEEESENNDDVEGVSESEFSEAERGSMKAKVVIPRAIVSLDDDEFDEILDRDEEGDVLLRVTKAPSDEEAEVEDGVLQFGDKGVVDEPECSDSSIGGIISTEEEVVKVNYSDKFDDGLMSSGNIEELSLSVPPGGSNDFMVVKEGNSIEAGMESGQSFKQVIEKGNVQRTINNKNACGSIHELDTLMKPGDAERVEDNGVELAEMGMSDTPECSGSVTDELFSKEEDMLQEKSSDDGLVSFETSLGVVPGGFNELMVECEVNTFDADRGLDEAFSQIVEQGVGQGGISKNGNNKNDDNTSYEAAELLIPSEESVGSGSGDSEDEDAGNMIGEAKEHCENDCGAVTKLEEPAYEDETKIGVSFESFQLTPTMDSTTTRNLEVTGEVDAVVTGGGSSDQKANQESENQENQESNNIVRKLSLHDGDLASSLQSSFETANETMKNEEKITKQVGSHPDIERNQISLSIEETSLLSVKDVERTMPQKSLVIDYDITKNEKEMARLIHNHTLMELDESKETGDRRNKLSETTLQNYLDSLYSNQSVDLISEKVKERVKKTKLLKEKLERIIRTGLCSEDSTATEVASKLSLPGKHPTSLGLDYMSDRTKIMLHEQDFSVNVLVIGKTGVGKSATINSIFGETKSAVGAFGVTTKSVKYVTGNVGGIRISILDTPGILSPATEEQFNQEVLMSITTSMRKFPVDVILYIDRLDDTPDICLLKTITSSLGSSIWQNAIVVLTHASSDVPDTFIAQRSSLMHQSIRQAVPELSKMPAVLLAENNSESTCPDWRLKLLILCCSIKIRSKAGQNKNVENVTLLCSFWNVLVNSGHTSHSHVDLEKKKRQLLNSYPIMICDEQSQECLEQETLFVENQEPEEEGKTKRGLKEGTGLGRVRRIRRGRLGFQATKRLGIYLDTSNLHTGFSIGRGDCRKGEEEEGRILVRKRSSMSVLGLVPVVMSVFTYVYGGKNI